MDSANSGGDSQKEAVIHRLHNQKWPPSQASRNAQNLHP
jgi:hypothetical protein